MVALVSTTGVTATTILGLVRAKVAEFEPFFHCKVSWVCMYSSRMFPPDACSNSFHGFD
jgi:hypothetical protein